MDATPIAGRRHAGKGKPPVWRTDTPAETSRGAMASWGLLVHPSLMPTVFAPGSNGPAPGTSGEEAERKV